MINKSTNKILVKQQKAFTPLEIQGNTNAVLRPRKRGLSLTGFTLIEMLIAAFIMIVITGILTMSMIEVQMLFKTNDIMAQLHSEARYIAARIVSDLRSTSLSKVQISNSAKVSGAHDLKFKRPNFVSNNPVVNNYALDWDPSEVQLRFDPSDPTSFVRQQQGQTIILSKNIKNITFADYNTNVSLYPNEVRLNLTLQKADSRGKIYTFSTISVVDMRN